MTTSAKTIGAAAGSLILLSSAALAAAPAVMDITADATPAATVEQATEARAAESAVVQRVEGQFSYDQGVVTPNAELSSVFTKAAATLCQTPEEESAGVIAETIKVTLAGAELMEATVADMAESEGASSYTIGCACASNAPGGGAVANAEVSGVSIASLAALAA